jgi:ABC-type transport system substrate-binding protein
MVRYPRADVAVSYFGMEHPVVGGNEPHKVALRRAISLAVDVDREIRLVRRGQAVPAQGPIAPETTAYDPQFKSEMASFDRARAKALLDMHGYVDRDGDGWRELPDGGPLLLEYATDPAQERRQLAEQWQRNMKALGLRIEFQVASWPENAKRSRAGGLMVWSLGWLAGQPDADTFLALGYGPQAGAGNPSRFALPAYDALYERQRSLPDGPERLAAIRAAQKLLIAYMPMKVHVHHVSTDMAQRWVEGYCPNVFVPAFWKYVAVGPHRAHAGAPPE